jgi:soluble lytic murein transglycosylase
MQIMPATFDWLMTKPGGTGENHDVGMLFDPATNIKYGTFYLSYLYGLFGDWDLTFAAYNAGQGRVRNYWMNDPDIVRDGELIISAIPFEETRNYLIRVNRSIEMYRKLYFP